MFAKLPDEVKELIRDFLGESEIEYELPDEIVCDFDCNNKTPACTYACKLYYIQTQRHEERYAIFFDQLSDWYDERF